MAKAKSTERVQVRTRGAKLQALRRSVMREQPLCVACERAGRVTLAVELDHVVPLAKGGTDERANLQPLCKACHDEKSIRERGDMFRAGARPDGTPRDPWHHWYVNRG